MKKIFSWQNILAASLYVLAVVSFFLSVYGVAFVAVACVLMGGACGWTAYLIFRVYRQKDQEYKKLKAEFIVVCEERYGEDVVDLEMTEYSQKNEKRYYRKIGYIKYTAIFFGVVAGILIYEVLSLLTVNL